MKKKIAVLLSGRGSNFISIKKHIESGDINADIVAVISNKQDAKGLETAKEAGLNAVFVNPRDFSAREEYDRELVRIIQTSGADLVCLAGFMRIITPYFINSFKDRIINIHPSLLPSFKGLDAQKQAFDYGVRFSGCTVHFVDEEMDHGAIILQAVVPVLPTDTDHDLAERILKEEHKIYPEAVKLFCADRIKIEGRKVIIR